MRKHSANSSTSRKSSTSAWTEERKEERKQLDSLIKEREEELRSLRAEVDTLREEVQVVLSCIFVASNLLSDLRALTQDFRRIAEQTHHERSTCDKPTKRT